MASRKGELRVKVISAKGLRDTAIFGIQDPYVQLEYGSLKVKTAVHRDGGTSPVWNESIKLCTLREAPTKLLVKVKNSNTLKDNRVGSTEIDLSDVFACQHEQVSAPLFTRDGRQRGEVQLSITFQPADPLQASFTAGHASPATSQTPFTLTTPDVGVNTTPDLAAPLANTASRHASQLDVDNGVSEAQSEAFQMPDQADLGPLGQSLVALSMTHISHSRLQTADAGRTHSQGSFSQTISTLDSASSHATAPVSASACASVPGQHDAAPVKRNYYPEESIDDEPSPQEPLHRHHHHHLQDLFHQHHHHNQAAGDVAAATAVGSRHAMHQSSSPATAAAARVTDEPENASYTAQEIFTHQYAVHASPSAQHEQAHMAVPHPPVSYPAVLPQHLLQQTATHLVHPGQGSVGQGSLGQGSQQQPYISSFHLLGTSPLHDGHIMPSQLSQHNSFSSSTHSAPQQIQHQSVPYSSQSGSPVPYASQQYPDQLSMQQRQQSVTGSAFAPYPHETPQTAHLARLTEAFPSGHSAQQYTAHQSVQPSSQSVTVPAWRLLGTSPLQDSWNSVQGSAAVGDSYAHDSWSTVQGRTGSEHHLGISMQPLTYASLAVQSWSTRTAHPAAMHRPFNADTAQEDFAVSHSAPSAPSLPSSGSQLQCNAGARFAESVASKQAAFPGSSSKEGRPPLPDQAVQKSLIFSSLGMHRKVPLTGATTDGNAVV